MERAMRMKVFILFFYLYAYHTDGGMTITSGEFNNQQACEQAARAMKNKFTSFSTNVAWVCTPKE